MKRSLDRCGVLGRGPVRRVFLLPLAVWALSACSSIGLGISLPIGGIGSVGVGVNSGGQVSGGVAVGRGGASVGVGGTANLPRNAPARGEPAASAAGP